MITTAAGLIVGIPALVGHNWLRGRVDGIVFDLEVYATKVLDALRRRRRGGPDMDFQPRAQARARP